MMFDTIIQRLNLWGGYCARIAWPLFWQSSVLIAGMFLLDLFLRRRLRPSVRHALWLVVLVKLLLPPSFALPSGIGWWLRPREVAPAKPPVTSYVVTYGSFHEPRSSRREEAPSTFLPALPSVRLSTSARALLASSAISATLLIIMLVRWRHLRRQLNKCQPAPIWLEEIVHGSHRKARRRRPAKLMLTDASISPALCGLLRPVIVLPVALVQQLRPDQLRAVLLHELFHLRNGDVWINCFQSLLQIAFWWHPFLWLANARIRRIREEVVDDAVRLALGEEAENYAPTLLEVARLALARPLATLGLVGILESRHALKQRIDRLVNFPAPRRVGLSVISVFAVLAFASVALPMGQAPPKITQPTPSATPSYWSTDTQWTKPILYYTYDQSFLDYFGSNGVEVVEQALAQINSTSDPSRHSTDLSEWPLEPKDLNFQADLSINKNAMMENQNPIRLPLGLQPLTENGSVDFNLASGIATATNGVVLTYGDTTLSADSITLNRETGEVVAEGFVQLKKGNIPDIPLGSKFHSNITNRLFAQNQHSVIGSSRIPQAASGRRAIMRKLEAIRLNNVTFDNLPLSEVVNYLRDEARKRDPEGKGINFLINPNADMAGLTQPTAIDPTTGLQVPPQQVEPADINGVAVRILPALNDVRMIDVLDAITKVADKRIRYSIEDYGVSFRLDGTAGPALFTRVIKVDPNAFAQGLESVVGFSVGNFQTGGQGGGGQQGNSSVTVPRVQVAPNAVGGQGAQGGAQGGAGGISGVTRPTTAITPQAIRQFFANAGVDLTPPKSFYLNFGEGALTVHATTDELDTIEKAVGALSTTAPQPITARMSETPSHPVPPGTNGAKIPVLEDLPVVSPLFQVRTAQVSAANSPQPISNAANTGTGDKLVTRIIKVNPDTFREGIRTIVPLPDNANPQQTMDAFRKLVLSSGVELRPPANMFYSERAGSLFVRAIAPEMHAIEQMVAQLNYSPPQINIQAKFVEVSEGDMKSLGLNNFGAQFRSHAPFESSIAIGPDNPDTNGPVVTILTDPQFRIVLHALEQRDGANLMSESSVTTVSGRQAQVQNVDVQTIVKLNPQALVPPGVASSNVYVTERLLSGPLLDIIPYVSEGGDKIQLTVSAKVTEFVGYDAPESGEAVPVYLDGQATTIKPPHPRTHVRSMQLTAVNLTDGQTFVLGRPKDEMITYDPEGKALSAPSTTKKNLLVFVTATLIDPTGNPVHKADSSSTTPQSH